MSSKTIQINPELFQISGNTTRKKRSPSQDPKKIKIKTGNDATKPKNMSTIKRNILKMIRNHQNEKRKKTATTSATSSTPTPTPIIPSLHPQTSEFKNDFKESLDFLSTLVTDVEKKQNQTIRRYPVNGSSLPTVQSANIDNSSFDFPTTPEIHQDPILLQKPPILLPPPKYGCLKNGKLPTYRTWLHQTRKQNPIIMPNPTPIPTNTPYSYNPSITYHSGSTPTNPINQTAGNIIPANIIPANIIPTNINPANPIYNKTDMETDLETKLRQISKIKQFSDKKQISQIKPWKIPKQKKTIRRTYYVGKSKVHPKVSVLISNKTIRANTALKTQNLKQTPISEVRKYLVKNGFIKGGTNAPNDVLREMYENAHLICGEIKNHNPENLLYNYFHTDLTA